MNRRVYLLGVGLALVTLAFAGTDAAVRPPSGPPSGPNLTEANALRIKKGMTLEQVEALFGKRCDDYEGSAEGAWVVWSGKYGTVDVYLDEEDKVTGWEFTRPKSSNSGILARLRAWLGW